MGESGGVTSFCWFCFYGEEELVWTSSSCVGDGVILQILGYLESALQHVMISRDYIRIIPSHTPSNSLFMITLQITILNTYIILTMALLNAENSEDRSSSSSDVMSRQNS